MKKISYFSLFGIILFLSSCAVMSYSPKVNLDISPQTISRTVTVEKLKDNSPPEDKNNPFMGFSATNKESLSNDLETEVTNAIVSDFSTNALFKNISRRTDNPDIIMKGEIKRFVGKSRPTIYAYIGTFLALPAYGIIQAPNAASLNTGVLIGATVAILHQKTSYK